MATNSIDIELYGKEYSIEDANSLDSWIKGLSSFINEKANEHYTFAFESESENYEIADDTQRAIAGAVSQAFVKFRADAAKSDDEPKDTWEFMVRHALRKAIGLEDVNNHWCPQEEALDASSFDKLKGYLEDILDEHEGPEIDLDADDIFSEINSQVVWKMQELDPSSELSTYGKAGVKFIFVPGLHPNGSIDDTSIYLDDLQELKVDSEGFDVLMKLTGVDALELMEALNVDHTDTALIDQWMDYSSKQEVETPLVPVHSSDNFNLIYLLENSGVNYGTPMWMGELSINELISLNPLEDIYLSGGSVGINDWNNGAGFMMDMPKAAVIKFGPQDWLDREYGSEMECQKGVASNKPPAPKKKPSLVLDDGPSF